MSDLTTMTRRYPRTLNEAFPQTVEYGQSIYGPYKAHRPRRLLRVCAAALLVAFIVVLA